LHVAEKVEIFRFPSRLVTKEIVRQALRLWALESTVLYSLSRVKGTAANFMLRQEHHVREWSTLLRHLAYQPVSFDRAALLLIALAEHEEGNNADCREAWREIFHIGLSGTLALPSQRV
jgi:hypothetical protein